MSEHIQVFERKTIVLNKPMHIWMYSSMNEYSSENSAKILWKVSHDWFGSFSLSRIGVPERLDQQ